MRSLLLYTQLLLALLWFSPANAIEEGDSATTEVVFLRSSMVGSMIKSSIYEVTGGDIKFIGILKNKKKITYKTTPGKHTFMVISEAADFMEADLDAGKTYYSIITPRMGAWKARFSMWPIRNDGTSEYYIGSKDFNKWMKKVKAHEPDEKDANWYEKHQDSVHKKMEKYWPVWLEKTAEQLAERTLKPGDGVVE